MNQILFTGDEAIREPVPKQKKVLPINGIVMFFAISAIILGICIASGAFYAKFRINEMVETSIEPEIQLDRDEENNSIKITVTHIRGISTLTYQWNEEKEIVINGENKQSLTETIDLIGGENILKISVTEENGNTKTIQKTFIAGNIPEIELEAIQNGVKIIASCKDEIDYVEYSWDDEKTQKIEVGNIEYNGIVNAPSGQHILKIVVSTINNVKAKKEQTVIGDLEPTINIDYKIIDGKTKFIIDVEDDQSISTLEIKHNGGDTETIQVNEKNYHYEVIMTEGENTLIVRATNINGLQKTRGIKFEN